jgi:hypothetical protein
MALFPCGWTLVQGAYGTPNEERLSDLITDIAAFLDVYIGGLLMLEASTKQRRETAIKIIPIQSLALLALVFIAAPRAFDIAAPHLFDLYRTKRDALIERFGAKMSGSVGATALTKDEGDWVAPRAYELNNLVQTMIQRTGRDSDESKGLLQRMHALFVKEFKLNPKLEFKKPY